MIVECKSCGAPLDLADGKTFTKCLYCKTPQQVREMRTASARTPTDFTPPNAWQGAPKDRPLVLAVALLTVALGVGVAFYVATMAPSPVHR